MPDQKIPIAANLPLSLKNGTPFPRLYQLQPILLNWFLGSAWKHQEALSRLLTLCLFMEFLFMQFLCRQIS